MESIRPTKKQKIMLDFIDKYISEHGYSPSYREIMQGLNYKSVASVAALINELISRGHLIKRGKSARSLELVNKNNLSTFSTNLVEPAEEKWLVEKIEREFKQIENETSSVTENSINDLYMLIGTLRILGLQSAAQSFTPRINSLKKRNTQ